jgi:hypothetical protein
MDKDEALKLALEALESCDQVYGSEGSYQYFSQSMVDKAISAIKQALAAPVQKRPPNCGTSYCSCIECIMPPAQPAPVQPVQEPVAWIDSVMEQAQVFASAWSLVGSRFDYGNGLEEAEQAKAELRAMLASPPAAQPAPYAVHLNHCNIGECEGVCKYLDDDCPALKHADMKAKWDRPTPPAQPAPVQPIIGSYLEKDNSQFKFSDYESDGMHHNKPAVPDAIGPNEDELPAYAAGWNDCRAEMLKGMKP